MDAFWPLAGDLDLLIRLMVPRSWQGSQGPGPLPRIAQDRGRHRGRPKRLPGWRKSWTGPLVRSRVLLGLASRRPQRRQPFLDRPQPHPQPTDLGQGLGQLLRGDLEIGQRGGQLLSVAGQAQQLLHGLGGQGQGRESRGARDSLGRVRSVFLCFRPGGCYLLQV